MEVSFHKDAWIYLDSYGMVKKRHVMTNNAQEIVKIQKDHETNISFSTSWKNYPKEATLFSMWLTTKYFSLKPEKEGFVTTQMYTI